MSYGYFSFETRAFTDSDEIRAQNVNGITGHTLAMWLARQLRAAGITVPQSDVAKEPVPDVWAEDHGWDFYASDETSEYLISCSVDTEAGDTPNEAHVTLGKQRSLVDRLLGRNKYSWDDGVVRAVKSVLEASPAVSGLEIE